MVRRRKLRRSGGPGAFLRADRARYRGAKRSAASAQSDAAVGSASAGCPEAEIGVQMIKIIGVFVVAGDGQHARAKNDLDAVCQVQRPPSKAEMISLAPTAAISNESRVFLDRARACVAFQTIRLDTKCCYAVNIMDQPRV
jgi:hypothetical protein